MNFGLVIFLEDMAEAYVVWKYGVDRTWIGDDINEKQYFDMVAGWKFDIHFPELYETEFVYFFCVYKPPRGLLFGL